MSRHVVRIEYCPRCRWLARAAWLAQELLATFEDGLDVVLSPAGSGVFRVVLGGEVLFDRRAAEGFVDPVRLKQALRDRIAPGQSLGHADRGAGTTNDERDGGIG